MKWNEENYKELINYLEENKDEKYGDFQSKLIKDDRVKLIGVRTPLLKKIAKYISKNDYEGFIKINKHQYFEENLLHGLILGNLKVEEEVLLKRIDEFMPYNDNWAINDLTCTGLKAFKKIPFDVVFRFLKSKNPWEVRFGLILIIDFYIKEEHLNQIFDICDNIKSEEYYVKMGNAWLLSICYVKFPKQTYAYLKKCNLDKFTLNKTISKICDSYRVDKKDKEKVKLLRTK